MVDIYQKTKAILSSLNLELFERNQKAIEEISTAFLDPTKTSDQIEDLLLSKYKLKEPTITEVFCKLVKSAEVLDHFRVKILFPAFKLKVWNYLELRPHEIQIKARIKEEIRGYKGQNLKNLVEQIVEIKYQELDYQIIDEMIDQLQLLSKEVENPEFWKEKQSIQFQQNFNDLPQKKQELINLITDYQRYPRNSLQKAVQRQIIIHFQQNYNLQQKQNLESNLEELKCKFQQEFKHVDKEVENIFKNLLVTKEKVYQNLCLLKKKIMPINVLQCERLIMKTKQSQKAIQGHDIFFLIGATGAGKSTSILRFLGYKLKKVLFNGKLPTFVPTQPLQQEHKTFHTSPQSTSCTRYINAVQLPIEAFELGVVNNRERWFICDSPGLWDSGGIEIQIANCVGMIRALRGCRSLRMVVLLPKDSLTHQRMSGAVKISQTMSKLFVKLGNNVITSMSLLFTKFTYQHQKSSLQFQLDNKLKHLTVPEAADQKVTNFLKMIRDAAKNQQNFIDPIQTDFRKLLGQIRDLTSISKIHQQINYSFTPETNKQIDGFCVLQNRKVSDKIEKQQYQQAKFHFEILQLMKENLEVSKVNQKYAQALNFIEDYCSKKFKSLQHLYKQLIDNDKIQDYQQIKILEQNIAGLSSYFPQFKIPGLKEVSELRQRSKQKLTQKFKTIQNLQAKQSIKLRLSIKNFAEKIDSSLKANILQVLNLKLNEKQDYISQRIKKAEYNDLNQPFKTLIRLQQNRDFNENNQEQSSRSRKIIKILNETVNKLKCPLKLINLNTDDPKNQESVQKLNSNLQILKQIQQIDAMNHNKEITNIKIQFLLQLEKVCHRGLEQLRSIIKEDNFETGVIRRLSNKKKEISNLLTIDPIKQKFHYYFDFTLSLANNSLKESTQLLKQTLQNLQNRDSQEKQHNINKIRKAINFVRRCSEVLGRQEEGKNITDKICEWFKAYLKHEQAFFNSLNVRFGKISEQTYKKIEQCDKKITTFKKIADISTDISEKIDEILKPLKEKFHRKLEQPFITNKISEITTIVQGDCIYKNLHMNLNKFENLLAYSNRLQQILSAEHDQITRVLHKEIIPVFDKKMLALFKDYQSIENQVQTVDIGKFKYVVQNLLAISGKPNTIERVSRFQIQVQASIGILKKKVTEISDKIELQLSEIMRTQTRQRLHNLQILQAKCKSYDSIQKMLFENNSNLFKDKYQKITLQVNIMVEQSEQSAKIQIRQSKPSQIDYRKIKRIYDSFNQINNSNKKEIILNEFQKILTQKQNKLIQIQRDLNQGHNQVLQQAKLFELFQEFNQTSVLQTKLTQILASEDFKNLNINKKLLKSIYQQLINCIKGQYGAIWDKLTNMNIPHIQPRINTFGRIQACLMRTKQNLSQQQKKDVVILFQKWKEQIQLKIKTFSEKEELSIAIKKKNIRELLKQLFNQIFHWIKKKYSALNAEEIVFDKHLIPYYQSLTKEGRQKQIKERIYSYFKKLFDQLKAIQMSSSRIKELNSKIDNSIQYLPPALKYEIAKIRAENQQEIIKISSQFVIALTNNIDNDENQFKIFFQKLNKAFRQKLDGLHQILINQFEAICLDKSHASTNLPQRISFIKKYLIKNLKNFKEIIITDSGIKKKMNNIFNSQIDFLVSASGKILQQLKNLISIESIKCYQNEEEQLKAIIQESFSTLFIIFQPDIDLFEKSSQYKKLVVKIFIQSLTDLGAAYKLKLSIKPPNICLASIDSLNPQKYKSLREYLMNIQFSGKIVQQVKEALKSINIGSEYPQLKEQKQTFLKLANYQQKFNFFKEQAKYMVQSINQFKFFNQIKKNWTEKQTKEDLIKFDTMFFILRQKQSFMNETIIKVRSQSFSFTRMQAAILAQYEQFYNQSDEQATNIFDDYNYGQTNILNVFISVSRIAIEIKMNFVQQNILLTRYKSIIEKIKKSFEEIHGRCILSYKAALEYKLQIDKDIQASNKQRDQQIFAIKNDISKQKQRRRSQIISQIDSAIANEVNQANKETLQQKKNVELNSIKHQKQQQLVQGLEKITKKHQRIITQKRNSLSPFFNKLAQDLIFYKKATLDINYQSQKQNQNLDAIIEQIPKGGPKFVSLLIDALQNNQKDKNNLGKVLLNSYKIFSSYLIKIRNKQVKGSDINYVKKQIRKILANLKVRFQQDQLDTIAKQYMNFNNQFQDIKQMYVENPQKDTIYTVVSICRDFGKRLKQEEYSEREQNSILKVPLLASIFGLWAILKSEKYEKQIEFPIEPHPTQIATMILLLGISKSIPTLENRLAQVGTGEGKSVIIAGLSCYLSLVGFKVRCACYSAYLSARDRKSFKQLFQMLNVQNNIKYGTFNELCQDILNIGGKDFKQEAYKLLLRQEGFIQRTFHQTLDLFGLNQTNIKLSQLQNQQKTILIIDEVDVFFQGNFFGKSYCPAITLRDASVEKLLEHVWSEVQRNKDKFKVNNVNDILNSSYYRAVVAKFKGLQTILKNQVHGMVSGAFSYKHDYFIIDGKIVYKDNDSISPSLSYGYKTVFANIYQYKKGNISKLNYEKALGISLAVAQFSYALLPKYFRNILGVTGTLQVMPSYKKAQLINRYKVKEQFVIPSAFGMEQRRVQNYYIVESSHFYQKIIERILAIQDRRPIIIFFKTAKELNQFACSLNYQPLLPRTFNLTEEHQPSVRDARIIRATNSNMITLMTNSFGRGTDFILFGKEIKQAGGLHVIQTFISLDQSEEVQIKGRSARQANKGSYDCIINEIALEEIGLKIQDIPKDANSQTIYKLFLEAREKNTQKIIDSTMAQLKRADKNHLRTQQIFDRENLAQPDLARYIAELNAYPQMRDTNVRTILGLDATGSMAAPLAKTCSIIQEAFTRAYEVLKQDNVQGTFQIKIIVYRNYNSSYEEAIQSTAFENTPNNLKLFLRNVTAKGGWVNQAIELFLQAVNKEKKVDQLILIGDASWNLEPQVKKKRERKGQNYWNSNNFPMTTTEKELQKIIAQKIPLHTFPLWAFESFKELSDKTGGRCSHFKVDHPQAANELTGFVVENILKVLGQKSGQEKAGERLVETYRKLYQ